jgi:hypothetical protein
VNPLTNVLTPAIRKTVYVVYALLGVAFGAVHVAYGQQGIKPPTVLGTIEAVVLFLGGAFGLTAASNVTQPDPQAEIVEDADTDEGRGPSDPRDVDGDGRDDSNGRFV